MNLAPVWSHNLVRYFLTRHYDLCMSQKKSGASGWTFHSPFGVKKVKINGKKKSRPLKLGPVTAERSFTLFKRDGTPLRISVRLGMPYVGRGSKAAKSAEYRCPVQIVGLGDEAVVAPWGEDSFTALQSAIEFIGVKLDAFVRRENLETRFRSRQTGWVWRYPPD
jgi:hypothetical protein